MTDLRLSAAVPTAAGQRLASTNVYEIMTKGFTKLRIHTGRSSWGGHCKMLDTPIPVWLIRNTKKFLGLLLLEGTHLILKKFALKEALSFVFETF